MRALLKVAIVAIFCCIAFFLIRIVIRVIDADRESGRLDRLRQRIERPVDRSDYSAKISELTIEHNQDRNGEYGMYVYSTQTWRNLKGVTCYSVLRFFDDQGNPLKGKTLRDDDGDFCVTGTLVSKGKNCETDQRFFVPYSEFDIPNVGTAHFLCDIRLYIINENDEIIELAYSKPCRFHITR